MNTATILQKANRFLLLLSLFILPAAVPVSAQIVYELTDYEALLGHTYDVTTHETGTTADVQALIDKAGENQTWDFTTLSFESTTTSTVQYLELPANTPRAAEFEEAGATAVVVTTFEASSGSAIDSTAWIYHGLDGGLSTYAIVFITGEDLDQDGQTPDTISFMYEPPLLQHPLPLSYGDAWSDTTEQTIRGITVTSSIDAEVDGYGMLMLPGDRSAPVLRIRKTLTTSLFGQESSNTSYTFLTKDQTLAANIFIGTSSVKTASYQIIENQAGGSSNERPDAIPERLTLGQNYPNPFSGNTIIHFALPRSSSVELAVYDLLGRRVATLADGHMPAGTHSVGFNAQELASGVYLYRLEAGGRAKTHKLVVVE